MKQIKNAFTLVELIVVITILAVLATVWFVSFIWYSSTSRDSVRLTDMKSIDKWLMFHLTKNWQLPFPENSIDITASGSVVNYQWFAGKKTLNSIWIHDGGIDPVNKSYYIYSLNALKNKYQILWFLENKNTNYTSKETFATNKDKFFHTFWENLWVFLDEETYNPIQNSKTSLDILNSDKNLIIVNWTNDSISGSGSTLYQKFIYSRSSDMLNDQSIVLDDRLLVLWKPQLIWTKIKDISKNEFHADCYVWSWRRDCTSEQVGVDENGVNYIKFNWDHDSIINIENLANEKFPTNWTIIFDFEDTHMGYHTFFDNRNDARNHFFIRRWSSTKYQFAVQIDTNAPYLSATSFDTNVWRNQIAFSWDQNIGVIKLYLNWKLLFEDTIDKSWVPNGQKMEFSWDRFSWKLYNMFLFNQALWNEQINKIYNIYN